MCVRVPFEHFGGFKGTSETMEPEDHWSRAFSIHDSMLVEESDTRLAAFEETRFSSNEIKEGFTFCKGLKNVLVKVVFTNFGFFSRELRSGFT